MKKQILVVILALISVSGLLAQNGISPNGRFQLGVQVGTENRNFVKQTEADMNGKYAYGNGFSVGIKSQMQLTKRFSFRAALMQETGTVDMTLEQSGNLGTSSLLAIPLTLFTPFNFLDNYDGYNYDAGYRTSVKRSRTHVSVGGDFAWVARDKVQLYSALSIEGSNWDKMTFRNRERTIETRTVENSVGAGFVPLGLRFGKKTVFDLSWGIWNAPKVMFGVSRRF